MKINIFVTLDVALNWKEAMKNPGSIYYVATQRPSGNDWVSISVDPDEFQSIIDCTPNEDNQDLPF